MSRRETTLRVLEVIFAGLAVGLSVAAIVISMVSTAQSNKISAQALEIARQANDISLGRSREYPVIEITGSQTKDARFTNLNDTKSAKILLFLMNRGSLPLSGVQLMIVGVGGLTYSLDDVKQYHDLGRLRVPIDFDEQLVPNGMAHLDIKVSVLKYLRALKPPFANPNAMHRSVINVVVLPRRAGEDLPLQTPGLKVKDREIITVEYIPAVLYSEEFGSYLDSQKPTYNIFTSVD